MSTIRGSGAPPFLVLLGPDYAGKSTAMTALAGSAGLRLISVDDATLGPRHQLVSRLRRDLVQDALPALGRAYSADFALTLLQAAVVHLRDQVLAADDPTRTVLVDSYYYKILAKCRLLLGRREHPMFDWWRTFPQPGRVLFLDVRPETAWRRSRAGAAANRLEHYGTRPEPASFAAYQHDLRRVMLEEVRGLPLERIGPYDDPAAAARALGVVLASTGAAR